MEKAIENAFMAIFYPLLSPIFDPINTFLLALPRITSSICGVGIFIAAMLWVGLIINKDYVNRGRPYKSMLTDLRLWTVISMTPHVLVYFYFK
jgi:hypothetical protein